jgi:hypothetical protein
MFCPNGPTANIHYLKNSCLVCAVYVSTCLHATILLIIDSTYSLQQVQRPLSVTLISFKYLFVVRILCTILNWKYLRFESVVVLSGTLYAHFHMSDVFSLSSSSSRYHVCWPLLQWSCAF